jgi:hypothetical protein
VKAPPPPTTTTTAPKTTTTTSPHAPVANADSTVVTLGVWRTVSVLANDTDVDGNLDPTTLTAVGHTVGQNINGQLDTSQGQYRIRVRLNATYVGPSWVDYRVCDSTGLCATGRITITTL